METDTTKALQAGVVLGIGAHPDDLDFMAAGTMAKLAAAGAEVYYLILTDGGKGSADPTMTPAKLKQIRQQEQRNALQAVGGKEVFFLDYEDGCLQVSMDLKRDIVRAIRRVRPDLVVAMDPTMVYSLTHNAINHPDHRAGGQAVLDAVFPLARDHMSFPELLEEDLQPHKVTSVLLTNFDKPNFYVDISDYFDRKMAALDANPSQFSDEHRRMVTEYAEKDGALANCRYAEGFVRIDIRIG